MQPTYFSRAVLTQVLMALSLVLAIFSQAALAQRSPPASETTALEKAQAVIAQKDWAKAEAMLLPLSQAEPKNPFVFYEMARVYENTGRADAAQGIYQGIANIPEADRPKYAVIVSTATTGYMTTLSALAQEKFNAIQAAKAAVATPPPAAAPVVVVAAAPVVPKAVPTPAPEPQAPPANAVILSDVNRWATAWANKDLSTYYSCYVNGHKGDKRTVQAWKQFRKGLVMTKNTIGLDLTDMRVASVSPTKAEVTFKQTYTSNLYNDVVNKTLVMVKVDNHWLIDQEIAVPVK